MTDKIVSQWLSQTDHAGGNETSLMLYYRPDLVDLSQLPQDRSIPTRGLEGDDARDATAQRGKEYFEASLEMVRQMFAEAGLL